MHQNFVVVFFALGYLGSSNAIHPTSVKYIGSVRPLLFSDTSLENMAASAGQLGPEFYSKTYAMFDDNLSKIQKYENNLIVKALRDGKTVLEFFQQATDSKTCTDPSKQSISEALKERLSKFTPSTIDPQLLQIALADIKEVGDEAREEFQTYLASALDLLDKHRSNLVYKILVKIDLLLAFYERTDGTGSFSPSSQISDQDQMLAADVPKIMNRLAVVFEIVSQLAEVVRNASIVGDN